MNYCSVFNQLFMHYWKMPYRNPVSIPNVLKLPFFPSCISPWRFEIWSYPHFTESDFQWRFEEEAMKEPDFWRLSSHHRNYETGSVYLLHSERRIRRGLYPWSTEERCEVPVCLPKGWAAAHRAGPEHGTRGAGKAPSMSRSALWNVPRWTVTQTEFDPFRQKQQTEMVR